MFYNMEIRYPHPAKWVPGQKPGSRILIDPEGFRMRFKRRNECFGFYECPKKKELLSAVDFNGKVDKYLNYFQRTWVGPIKKRSNGRGKPYFPLVL